MVYSLEFFAKLIIFFGKVLSYYLTKKNGLTKFVSPFFNYFFYFSSGRSLSLSSLDGEKIPNTPFNPTVITIL